MKKVKNFLAASGLIFPLLLLSGCVLFLVGAGVAGGVAISKDTIEGHTEKSLDRVYKASREVVMDEGFIRLEDKTHGIIESEVRKSEVKIEIRQITDKTVRIQVKARKGMKLVPNPALANELYNKIAQRIR